MMNQKRLLVMGLTMAMTLAASGCGMADKTTAGVSSAEVLTENASAEGQTVAVQTENVSTGEQAVAVQTDSAQNVEDDGWKGLYLELLSCEGDYDERLYTPVYINDDDIPEIVVTSESGMLDPAILFVQNGSICDFYAETIYYNERQGWFLVENEGSDGMTVCYLDQETLTVYEKGTAADETDLYDLGYGMDGARKTVSESEYQALLEQHDTDGTKDASESDATMSYGEFLTYLQEL